MEKPSKPQEPDVRHYPHITPVTDNSPYVVAHRAWQKAMLKYETDLVLYEQTKLIRFVKNADEKLILRKYKIIKLK